MLTEKLEPGEYRYVRSFSPGYLAVNSLLAAVSIALAIAAAATQIAAGLAGRWSWGVVIMLALGLFMCGMIVAILRRGAAADRRLAGVPTPAVGDDVLVSVKPKLGGTFAAHLVWSALSLVAAGYVLLRDDLWRVEVDPEVLWARRTLEELGIDASAYEVDAGEQLATVSFALTAVSWCLWLAACGTLVAVWLWSNCRREFLWFSVKGIGYLPSRVDDSGFRGWDDVASVAHDELMEGRAFWTTGHEFTIATVAGETMVVRMHGGLTSSKRKLSALLADVAPHVERTGIDPDGNPWGDVVPQRTAP